MATCAGPDDDLSREQRAQRDMPRAMVFTPSPLLTVTIEERPDGSSETHLHAGDGTQIERLARRVDVRLAEGSSVS